MKKCNFLSVLLTLLFITAASSQDTGIQASGSSGGGDQLGTETTEKTYTIHAGGKVIRNSVKITTTISQDIMFEEEDENKVEQDQIKTPKKITKTVLIDNDADDDYDEKIVFSYFADSDSDFTLVSNDDELLVGVNDGDQLNIVASERITLSSLKSNREAYIFTNKQGKEVQFYIEDYETLK